MTETTKQTDSGPARPIRRQQPDLVRRILIAVHVSLLGLGGVALSVFGFGMYGMGLFVYLPIATGFLSVFVLAMNTEGGQVTLGRAIGFSTLTILGVSVLLISLGLEGFMCLIMAVPLWFPEGMIGAAIAVAVLKWIQSAGGRAVIILALAVTVPAIMGAEWAFHEGPPMIEITTSIEVDAAPQDVWDAVIAFDPLPEPRRLLFRAGIAYPTHARIYGRGVGARRHCVFSTGAFIEPITEWDEPRALAFDVEENPAPMHELSFYNHVYAPHLTGYFVSERGRFDLVDLGQGRTRLIGTTWYRNNLSPQWYWSIWSNRIIHQIHERVLEHIKLKAETEVQNGHGR